MILSQNSKIFYLNYRKNITKWACINCVRAKSSAEPKTKTYSHTILLPKTNFPARSSNTIREEIQKLAKFSELYSWQREHLKGTEYVLHDGPPYANGDLHMGHAVNKIIKDITNRSQILQGNKVHYIPGWDCHGLPIELKALQKAKKAKQNELSSPINIRQIAREFALETVNRQKAAFETWGVMADWSKDIYLTLNKDYVQNQLRLFYEMYEKGLIYRALKPVYWSPSSKTALAEAELEYDPEYKSTEVYVSFPIVNVPDVMQDAVRGKILSAIIWTTTPWTLVANRAICYNPQMRYSIVTLSSQPKQLYLVGSGLIEGLERALHDDITKVMEFDGHHLKGTRYSNKLVKGITLPFLAGDHVTEGKGTGLVHTAPAHGPDDFLIALKNDMPVECNVDESGRYMNIDSSLNGLYVLKEGQETVISQLDDAVLHRGTYVHSYPLDWRTKKPVILRASQQWFIDTGALKERALAALEKVSILPQSSSAQARQGFKTQLEKRPYWCISRQRAWGVPIPVIYAKDRVIVDKRIIEKLCSLIEAKGSDVWWTCDVGELLTDDLKKEYGANGTAVKGKDILDIWFDSGVSWSGLGGRVADLYSEGVDQLTGWFQSSLLTSIALQNRAPYESIFVHGFVVDENKRKMSKSIGNVIEPNTIINGGKDKNNQPSYGVDTLRWWVASHSTQHSQIVISKKLLQDCQSEVIKIRNTMKFLLGVVSDVNKTDFHRKPTLSYFDKYLLSETNQFLDNVTASYNSFRFNNVAQIILYFVSNKVSSLYCQCVKDRLYCSPKDSNERLSAQLTVHTILIAMCKAVGPILPHLVEEVWLHHPLRDSPFYFTSEIPVLPDEKIDPSLMDTILDIKKDICAIAKSENLKKLSADIKLEKDLFNRLHDLNLTDGVNDSILTEVLELSSVSLVESSVGTWSIDLSTSSKGQCLRCRKFNTIESSDTCKRCQKVLNLY